jgi:hypothetical protein
MVTRAAVGTAARDRTLPLLPVFATLLPQAAVQRGSVVACHGVAAMSLALALAAGPSQQGAWVGVAGLPTLGLPAAAEAGVVLERLVAVAEPEAPWTDALWADLLAALIDGFDLVVLGPGVQQLRPGTARRLMARVQARGAVAVTVGAPVFGADLRFECAAAEWAGLGQGHGVAQRRRVEVSLSGRRVPRERRTALWLPAADGAVRAVDVTSDVTSDMTSDMTPVVPLRRTG